MDKYEKLLKPRREEWGLCGPSDKAILKLMREAAADAFNEAARATPLGFNDLRNTFIDKAAKLRE